MIKSIEFGDRCFDILQPVSLTSEEIYQIFVALQLLRGDIGLYNNETHFDIKEDDVFFIKLITEDDCVIDTGYTKKGREYDMITKAGKVITTAPTLGYLYVSRSNQVLNGSYRDLTFSDDYSSYRYFRSSDKDKSEEILEFINSRVQRYSAFFDTTLIDNTYVMLENDPEKILPIKNEGTGYIKAIQYFFWCYNLCKTPGDYKVFLLDKDLESGLDRQLVWLLFEETEKLGINLICKRPF